MDDAYIGGERPGKPGRGAEHKAPFIAVVETEGEEHRPQRMQLRTVRGFRGAEIECYAKTSLVPGSIVVSDGLACFKTVEKAGCHHVPFVYEGGALAEFEYRFNRRYRLDDMIERLAYVGLRTPPMPYRLLRMAEIGG